MGIKNSQQQNLNVYSVIGQANRLAESSITENIDRKIPLLVSQFKKPDGTPLFTPEEIKQFAADGDPTANAEYITWILKMIQKQEFIFPEDSGDCRNLLSEFHRIKKAKMVQVGVKTAQVTLGNGQRMERPEPIMKQVNINRDILTYKSYGELVDALAPYREVKTVRQTKKADKVAGVQFLGEHPSHQWAYFKITTPAGAGVAGKTVEWAFEEGDDQPTPLITSQDATHWCTRDSAYAIKYLDKGPLWLILCRKSVRDKVAPPKDGNDNYVPFAQLHFETQQFMDVKDNAISHQHKWAFMKLLQPWTGINIADDPAMAWDYAHSLNPNPSPQQDGETNEQFWKRWSDHRASNRRRFIEGEPAILRCEDPAMLTGYADMAFGGRWPEAEPRILGDHDERLVYAENIIRGDKEQAVWPELEDILLQEAQGATTADKAKEAITDVDTCRRSRWPEMEAALSGEALEKYLESTKKWHKVYGSTKIGKKK